MIIRNKSIKFLFFLILFISINALLLNFIKCYYNNIGLNFDISYENNANKNFATFEELNNLEYVSFNHNISNDFGKNGIQKDCTMDLCFDFNLCKDFKIYVYPDLKGVTRSDLLSKILSILRRSKYFTDDPNKACLFIPSLDTLHRDALSTNFDRQLNTQIQNLPFWNKNGLNHLIFNFYAGTWPNYYEDEFHMNVYRALLAKASLSTSCYRSFYDISMPLIHGTHSVYDKDTKSTLCNQHENSVKRYLLVFKGKRYLHGVGSYSRDSLHLLHNKEDIILVTTCRHGQDWMRFADKYCDRDMVEYDKYDYDELIHNSQFCLVPRGRRLGSYRFLEVLKAGCIPVMLSNDWVLPFSEIINWNEAVVWADERLIMQIPDTLRQISHRKIVQYRVRIKFLWNTYFSSVERITNTVIEIIKDRVNIFRRNKLIWNVSADRLLTNISQITASEFLFSNITTVSC